MRESSKRVLRLPPKIFYLTADERGVREQLRDERILKWDSRRSRMDDVSTDEITPGWACFFYDERLGDYAYVGLRGGSVQEGDLKRFGPSVVVSGKSQGCGSSRETAPYAELVAGVRLVIADSFEKIYRQNAHNIGLLTSTDMGLLPRILAGEEIPIEELTRGLDPVSAAIVERGGLAAYEIARLSGEVEPPVVKTQARQMTLAEKIIAGHAVAAPAQGSEGPSSSMKGLPAVAPGDSVFLGADLRFSHEYVTAMAASIFERGFGKEALVADPESCLAFRDHLTFLGEVMPEDRREAGLLEQAGRLATAQEEFARKMGIRLIGDLPGGGSHAICHNAVLEDFALPGQVIVGTDSHTCTAGALGAFSFGVGSTDMAAAWYTKEVRVEVPASVKVELSGSLHLGVTAKDLFLHLLTDPFVSVGGCVGKVMEFSGEGLVGLPVDERATLANMAVEAGAFTGIMAADEAVFAWLAERRPDLDPEQLRRNAPRPDPEAEYVRVLRIDLSEIEPMVAFPGSPRNAVPLSRVERLEGEPVRIDIAYGGSCTGGKAADMDMYASVLGAALRAGKRVAPHVSLFIQFGSQAVKRYARERGYFEIFEGVGANMLDPACGACINAGPGVSLDEETVSVSAINRNFPGRSGPGRVFLASPPVVAASAIAGYIAAPDRDAF